MYKYFPILAMLFLAAAAISCKKDELPTDESFTDCKNCTFSYQASNDDGITFTYKNYWEGDPDDGFSAYRGLVVEAPSGVTTFNYGKEEIISDKVEYIVMCINCTTIPYEAVDGKITGKKVRNDQWLIDANVTLEAPAGGWRDTMVFKQYFTREQ